MRIPGEIRTGVLTALVLALFSTSPVLAQGIVVEGTVVDSTRVMSEPSVGVRSPASRRADPSLHPPSRLAGARVWARETGGETVADEDGRFRLELPEPGAYHLTFSHARLDELGIEEAGWITVEVPPRTGLEVELAIPSRATLHALWCRMDPEELQEAIVAARVRSSVDGGAIAGIPIELRPSGGAGRGIAFAGRSGEDGVARFCGVRPETRYRLLADGFGVSTADLPVAPERGEVVEFDLEFEVGGVGTVQGQVRAGEAGDPVAEAVVALEGPVTRAGRTDADGRFHLGAVPAGGYALVVTHLEFRTVRRSVAVPGNDRAVNVEVRVLPDAIALEPLVVEIEGGTRPTWGLLAEVYDRIEWQRRLGLGHVFDREAIERSRAMRVSHLVARLPGVRARPLPGSPNLALHLNHRRCSPSVYVDGMRGGAGIDAFPINTIEAVEVYRRMSQLPGEFADRNAQRCGAIAVWTRRGR